MASEILFQNPSDMIINVGDESNHKTFYAHSLILILQSTYFRIALSSDWVKKDGNKIVFEKPNITPKNFEIILKYLYFGNVSLDEFTPLELLDLLSNIDEFMLPELMKFTESHLLSLTDSWMKTDFLKIYLHVQQFTESGNFQESCIEKFCKKPKLIFESNDFVNLSEELLINLLKKDNIKMKAVKVWKYIIKWGIYKCSNNLNEKNISEWKEENFNELWEILKNCIELIRFYKIPVKDFENNIKPFSVMFPRDVYEKLLWNYITKLEKQKNERILVKKKVKKVKAKDNNKI